MDDDSDLVVTAVVTVVKLRVEAAEEVLAAEVDSVLPELTVAEAEPVEEATVVVPVVGTPVPLYSNWALKFSSPLLLLVILKL